MFEKAIIDILASDTRLAALITSYNGAPAIFAGGAPTEQEMPYLTVRVTRNADQDGLVRRCMVFVDFWQRTTSVVASRQAEARIRYMLDIRMFETDQYQVRLFFYAATDFETSDPRETNYNIQFEGRIIEKILSEAQGSPATEEAILSISGGAPDTVFIGNAINGGTP